MPGGESIINRVGVEVSPELDSDFSRDLARDIDRAIDRAFQGNRFGNAIAQGIAKQVKSAAVKTAMSQLSVDLPAPSFGKVNGPDISSAMRKSMKEASDTLRRERAELDRQAEVAGRSFGQKFASAIGNSMRGIGTGFTEFGKMAFNGMSEAASALSRFSRQLGVTAFEMQIFGRTMTQYVTLPLVGGFAALSKVGLSAAADLEDAQIALTAMTKPGYDVVGLMERLKKLAIDSPVFETGPLVQFTQKMVGAGLSTEKTEAFLESLGRVMLVNGVSADKVSQALLGFSQAVGKGKLQSEEFTQQIAEHLPGALEIVTKQLGVTKEEFYAMVKKGEISGEELIKIFTDVGNSKEYLEGAAAGAETMRAKWQALKEVLKLNLAESFLANKDQIKQAIDDLLPTLQTLTTEFGNALPTIIENIGKLIEKLKEMTEIWKAQTPEMQKMIGLLVVVAAFSGPIANVAGAFTSLAAAVLQTTITLLINPFGLVAVGIALVTAGIALWILKTEEGRQTWGAFVAQVVDGWENHIKPAIETLWNFIQTELIPAFEELLKAIGFDSWKEFGAFLGGALVSQIMVVVWGLTGLAEALTFVINAVKTVIGWMKQLWQAFDGSAAQAKLSSFWTWFTNGWKQIWDKGRQQAVDFWNWFSTGWKQMWDKAGQQLVIVGNFFRDKWNATTDYFRGKFGEINQAWNDLVDFFKRAWGDATGSVSSAITTLKQTIDTVMNEISSIFTNAIDAVRTAWSNFFTTVTTLASTFRISVTTIFNNIRTDIESTFRTMVTNIGAAWSGIKAKFADPVIFVIDVVYNKGIVPMWNAVDGALGLGKKLATATVPHMATGGTLVPGKRSMGDWVPFFGTAGERVLSHDEIRRAGGYGAIDRFVSGSPQHFEDGGILGKLVGAGKDAGGWLKDKAKSLVAGGLRTTLDPLIKAIEGSIKSIGVNNTWGMLMSTVPRKILDSVLSSIDKNDIVESFDGDLGSAGGGIARILELAKKSGIPYRVSSTLRPGDTVANGGFSWHAKGNAVDFGGYNQDKFAQYWMGMAGSLLELIHRTNTRDYGISNGKPFSKNGNEALYNQHRDHVHVAMHGDGGGGGGAANTGGTLGAWILAAIGKAGVPSSWINPLRTLIMRESGGNPRAINLSDSNYLKGIPSKGLMQTIGPTFAQYRDRSLPNDIYDPVANIVAGINYIKARYGSIFNVQQAVGKTPMGYDNGGWVAPGEPLVNNTGRSEMMLNAAQGSALEANIRRSGAPGPIYMDLDLGEGINQRVMVSLDTYTAELVAPMDAGRGRI